MAAFGLLFFSDNPHPFEVKPVAFAVLAGIDVLLALWSVVIGVKGLTLAHSTKAWKSALVMAVVITAFTLVLFGAARAVLAAS
jgi:hypothetical protein